MRAEQILFVFNSSSIAQSYLNSPSFTSILSKYRVSLYFINLSPELILRCSEANNFQITSKSFIHTKIPTVVSFALRLLSEINRHAHQNRSTSFNFRETRLYPTIGRRIKESRSDYARAFRFNIVLDAESNNRRMSGKLKYLIRYKSLSLKLVQHLLSRIRLNFIRIFSLYPIYLLLLKLQNSRGFFTLLNSLSGDLFEQFWVEGSRKVIVCIPSNALNEVETIIVGRARSLGIQTLMMIDNWDNLSSKSILIPRPNFCTVWGDQMRVHAQSIQGFEHSQIFVLGTPRFDIYHCPSVGQIPKAYSRFILFLGSFSPFDELRILKLLDGILRVYNEHLPTHDRLSLVYRPHPAALVSTPLNHAKLHNVVSDSDYINSNRIDVDFDFVGCGLAFLIQNSEFVIGGLTTALLESSLLFKEYLALAHHEPNNVASPRNCYENYQHFRGIEKLPNLNILVSVEALERKVLELLSHDYKQDFKIKGNEINFFYEAHEEAFGFRLLEVLNKIH